MMKLCFCFIIYMGIVRDGVICFEYLFLSSSVPCSFVVVDIFQAWAQILAGLNDYTNCTFTVSLYMFVMYKTAAS